jgi:serine/threonine protein kinase/Flp pilus assembly protein TadD
VGEQAIGPFRVLRKLGAGGMGEVYLAEDERLGRRVALKCPSDSWLASGEGRARLHREARAAARLNDPRIAAVYDVLDIDGRPFIVMEYVEGEPLSAEIARGPVPLERALQIGTDLAHALAVAHAAGIVHRDLKPANVMVGADGRIKVLDFGLARSVDAPSGALTAPGHVLGTPGYLAPEQLLGRAADARTDIYSLGAILYELLTGHPPATADRARGLAALLDPPSHISSVNPSLPRHVSAIVMRALAPEPGDRYQSTTELAHALEHASHSLGEDRTREVPHVQSRPTAKIAAALLLAAVAATLLLLALPRWWHRNDAPAGANHPTPVVAVLPLTNLSGDPNLEYVGAGMADTMSTKLASIPGISVVSRAEIHEALQRTGDVTKVCRALGVTYAVTGGVQQAANRVQVTINLLSPDGRTIVPGGGRIYEDSLDNMFTLQRRIAEDLSSAMVGTLSPAARAQLARNPTTSVSAMSAYWRGRALMDKPGPAPIDPAIAAFHESIALDPSFALGHAGLGAASWRKYTETRDQVWATRAVSSAERARQLDPDQPEVRLALATVYNGVGRTDDALREAGSALELQPASYGAHRMLGEIRSSRGETEQAVAEFAAAIRIRPDYAAGYRSLGLEQMRAGRYADAAAAFDKMAELQPDSPFPHQLLGNAHLSAGDLDAAMDEYSAAQARGGSFATYSSLGYVNYLRGRFDDAVRSYQQAIERRPKSATTHWNLGDAYRRVGKKSEARKAYGEAVKLFDADLQVNPTDANATATRATCLARLGRGPEALAEASRAAQLAPGDQDVQYQRALVLTILGRTEPAIDALELAVKSGYSVPLLRLDEDLAPLRQSPRFQTLVARKGAASGRTT